MSKLIKKTMAVFLAVMMVATMFSINLTAQAEQTQTADVLTLDTPVTVEGAKRFAFVAPKTDAYVFYSSNGQEADPHAELYNAEDVLIADGDNIRQGEYDFKVGMLLTAGQTYYLNVNSYEEGTYDVNVSLSRVSSVEYIGNEIELTQYDGDYGNWILDGNDRKYFCYYIDDLASKNGKLKVTLKSGEVNEYTFNEAEKAGLYVVFDYVKSADDEWELGSDNEAVFYCDGVAGKVGVTINPSPVKKIELLESDFVFDEYDSNSGYWQPKPYLQMTIDSYFFYYEIYRKLSSIKIRVTYGDDSQEIISYYDENQENTGIIYTDFQEQKEWVHGGNNEIVISYKGATVTTNATLNKCNVASIDVLNPEVFEYGEYDGNHGWWIDIEGEDGKRQKSFYYSLDQKLKSVKLKVTYTDGSSEDVDYNENFFIVDDQRVKSFVPDGDNEAVILYKGARKSVNVKINETTVDKIEIIECDYAYNEGDADTGYWEQTSNGRIWVYNIDELNEHIKIKVIYKDGSYETLGYYGENGEPIGIVFEDEQYSNPWTPDGENEVTVTYRGKSDTLSVEIIPSPVKSIKVHSCDYKFIKEDVSAGHWQEHWDNETGSHQPYFLYEVGGVLNNISFEVEYLDGGSEIIPLWNENGENNGFDWYTNQYENPWTVGGENAITFTYMGKQVVYNAVIEESPIKSISIVPFDYKFIEKDLAYGSWDTRWNDILQIQERYFCYYIDDLLRNISFKIEYTDGETETIPYYNEDGYENGISASTNQNEKSWTVGGKNPITFTYMGKEVVYNAIVEESNVKSIKVHSCDYKYIKEDASAGNWSSYWDEQTGSNISYFEYNTCELRNSIVFEVEYIGGETETIPYYNEDGRENGFGYYCDQASQPWTVGGANEITFGYKGKEVVYNAVVEESPVKSISIVPFEYNFIKEDLSHGSWETRWNSELECNEDYFRYDISELLWKTKFVIEYTGGETETIPYYDENGNKNGITASNRQEEESWTVGGENPITFSYMGESVIYNVNIIESPIKKIEIVENPLTFIENDESVGNWANEYEDGEETDREYFNYRVWDKVFAGLKLKVTYNDDSWEEITYSGENGLEYSDIQNVNHFYKDAENYLPFTFMGTTINVPVTIVASPIKNITVKLQNDEILEYDEKYGGWEEYFNDVTQQNEYNFIYNTWDIVTSAEYVITYIDDTTETLGYWDDNDELTGIIYDHDQYINPWSKDKENFIKIHYKGMTVYAPVVIKENPVESIEVYESDYAFVFEDENNGNWSSYWDEELGQDVPYFYYHAEYLKEHLKLKVNYKGDTSEIISAKDNEDVSVWVDQAINPWTVGFNTVTIGYMGKKLSLDVEVVEPIVLENEDYIVEPRANNTVAIKSYVGDDTEVIVPETLAGRTVTEICGHAFSGGCNITSIKLPDTVKRIGSYAFNDCYEMHEFTFPQSLEELGRGVFGCNQMEKFYLSEENEFFCLVDGVLFSADKTKLYYYPTGDETTEYTVPDGVTIIGGYAFSGAQYLKKIVLPNGLLSIGESAFSNCYKLTYINLPDSLEEINDTTFGCTNIKHIVIPSGVEKIGCSAFMYSSLEYITFSNTLKTIEDNVFCECYDLKGIYFIGSAEDFAKIEIVDIGNEMFSQAEIVYIETQETCSHSDKKLVGVLEKDCWTDGYTGDEICLACGQVLQYGEAVEMGHTEGELQGFREAKCDAPGYSGDAYCTKCESQVVWGSETYKEHTPEDTRRDIVEADCANGGYTGDLYCADCEAVLEYGDYTESTGDHNKADVRGAYDATCTEDGYTGDRYCTGCEQFMESGEVIKAAHTKGDIRNAKAPTCAEYGYTGDNHCTVCGELVESGQTIDPTYDHKYVIGKYNDTEHWMECECGASDEQTHKYHTLSDYKKNDTHHWKECDCGYVTKEVEHTRDSRDYNTDGHWDICLCGYSHPSEEHSFDTPKKDVNSHWNECDCGAKADIAFHDHTSLRTDETYHWYECACGDESEKIVHTFTDPCYDDTHHWNQCICGKAGEKQTHNFELPKTNEQYHWDECACGKEDNAQRHDFNIPQKNDTHHWNECTCGVKDTAVAHNFSIVKNNEFNHWKECSCGKATATESHTFEKDNKDDNNHWKECACGLVDQNTVEAHTSGNLYTNETEHWYECYCGKEMSRAAHTYTEDCKDENAHWKECSCGVMDESTYAEHDFRLLNAGNEHYEECFNCGYEKANSRKPHSYDSYFILTEELHCLECICGAKDEASVEAHNFATVKKDGTHHWSQCDCGATTDRIQHIYNGVVWDDNYHWAECGCGAGNEKIKHRYEYVVTAEEHWRECACGKQELPYHFGHGMSRAFNDNEHWLECECGHKEDFGNHQYGGYKSDGTYHWKECFCSKTTAKVKHVNKTTVTKATISKNGKIVVSCSTCNRTISSKTVYYAKTFKLSTTSYTYNGKNKKPSVTVTASNGTKLKEGTDYTVSYPSSTKKIGTYKVTVKLKGNYTGSKTLSFKINPKGTTVSKLTAGKKSLKVSIKKQTSQTTGYEIQYSTSKKFTSAKTKKISKNKTTSATLTKLKAKKTYYVRVRTYKTVNGKKYYSGWSTYKYKKTK